MPPIDPHAIPTSPESTPAVAPHVSSAPLDSPSQSASRVSWVVLGAAMAMAAGQLYLAHSLVVANPQERWAPVILCGFAFLTVSFVLSPAPVSQVLTAALARIPNPWSK